MRFLGLNKCFVLGVTCFVFLLPLQAAILVGTLPGDVSVNNTGEAAYSLPLSVPSGTAGMQPALAVIYGHRSGNGIMGDGFSLSGLSLISRIASTKSHDGVIDGVDFDALDRLALDGQRLILVSAGAYGSEESEYRTEIDSFSKVTLHGADFNDPGAWFEVRTKSGLIYEYGRTSDAFVEPSNRTQAIFWAVDKVSDTSGNCIKFIYDEDVVNGEHLLQQIIYTGNDSVSPALVPGQTVHFLYEDREDTSFSYVSGARFNRTKRLKTIQFAVAGNIVHDYRLSYGYGVSGDSQLSSIQQFFPNGDSVPATVFRWTDEDAGAGFEFNDDFIPPVGIVGTSGQDLGVRFMDVNGDGLVDFVYNSDALSSGAYTNSGAGWASAPQYTPSMHQIVDGAYADKGVRFMDVDGNGAIDILYRWSYGYYVNEYYELKGAYLNSGSGFNTFSTSGFSPKYVIASDWGGNRVNRGTYFGDVNGDGLPDCLHHRIMTDGAVQKGAYLNTGTGWLLSNSYTPPYQLSDVFDLTGVVFTDVNGDQLPDMLYHLSNGDKGAYLNTGSGWETNSTVSYEPLYPLYTTDNKDLEAKFVDINGDGLQDFLYHRKLSNGTVVKGAHLNTGAGWTAESSVAFEPPVVLKKDGVLSQGVQFIDLNGDRRMDILYHNGTAKGAYLNNGKGWEFSAAYEPQYQIVNSSGQDKGSRFIDLNGDGLDDQVYKCGSVQGAYINKTEPIGLLKQVISGFRSEENFNSNTELFYRPITDKLIYTKDTGADYPVFDIQSPLIVVSDLSRDDGIGRRYFSTYTYAGACTHIERGFLGFRVFESYDQRTQLSQTEILALDFPFTGRQISSETAYIPDPVNHPDVSQRIKEVRNTYLYDTVQGGTIFPYVAKSVEKKWELGQTNAPMTEVTAYNWFDNQDTSSDTPNLTQPTNVPQDIVYGNITKIVMDYGNGIKQISSNQYYTVNTNTWLLGRLSFATVTHLASGKSAVTKTSAFEYDAATGLLIEEQIEPGHPTLEMTTDYQYDGFGNITNKIVSAPGVDPRAVLQNDYVAGGRFVSASRNIFGHGETYQYDQNTGLVTAKTGPNGLATQMEYDPLGRAVREIRADGTETTTQYAWDSSVTVSAPDPANPQNNLSQTSSYKITTQSSGSAPVTVWYDHQGREIRQMTLSPGGNKKVCQDTIYNGLGQVVAVSENYFLGETHKFGTSEYDALGRRQYVTTPDGTVTEYVYNGLTTQVIADSDHRSGSGDDTPKNQITTTIQNAQGQTLQVIDNLGNALTYGYDAAGNLIATTDSASNTVEMSYDIRGNKIQQADPDMGTWNYTYNALGELISQTDAKNQTTTMEYDTLGRMIKRTTPDGEARWFYDGTDEGCWLGSIRREELRDTNGNLTYRKTYAYDSFGRPMLELYNFDNKWYYTCYRYDQYSRLKFTDRFWRPQSVIASGDNLSPLWNVFSTFNTFNNYGAVIRVSDSTGHTWWKIDDRDFDAKGHLLQYTLGNDTITAKSYDADTGSLTAITCRNAASGSADIQNDLYNLDRLGNLKSRRNLKQINLQETFTYDGLNRLTSSTVANSSNGTVSVAYNAIGNILSKTGAGTYAYGQGGAKPHAVTQVTDNGSPITAYSYDANGNMVSRSVGASNTLTTVWTSFNKPKTMYSGLNGSRFTYDINNNRIRQIIETDDGLNKTVKKKLYIAGMEQDEEVTNPEESSETLWNWAHKETRIFINTPSGTVGIHVQTPGAMPSAPDSVARKYFHADHLGSIVAVTGEKVGDTAPLLAEYSFDAWGARRDASTWSPITVNSELITGLQTDRGFTGHEYLDGLGLIHMNGRIYDPHLGRFLSADPTLQFPGDMQNYNRYSYVHNNPLRYIDPSGYGFFSSIGNFFKKYWKVIVVVVIVVVVTVLTAGALTGPLVGSLGTTWGPVAAWAIGGAVGGFVGGFGGTLLNGGDISQALSAGLEGALWGGLAGATGAYIQGLQWGKICTALAQGATGSAISFAQGGSVESGFLAGFAGGLAGGAFKSLPGKVFAGAIVGGCASAIGGGKFESGAITGAFTALAWSALGTPEAQQKIWGDIKGIGKSIVGLGENIWQLPTDIVGKTIGGLSDMFGAERYQVNFQYKGNEYNKTVHVGGLWNVGSGNWGTSIGDDIFIGEATLGGHSFSEAMRFPYFRNQFIGHELGHTIQANILGPAYIPAVATFTGWSYDKKPFSWAEDWADRLATQIQVRSP